MNRYGADIYKERVCVMPEPTKFGERLKRLRERAGLTVYQLSARSGVPRASILGVERGTREGLSTESSARIARALGITIDRLVGDAFDDDAIDSEMMGAAV
jgi:transcriptional regulator with XRE-family HTH domain